MDNKNNKRIRLEEEGEGEGDIDNTIDSDVSSRENTPSLTAGMVSLAFYHTVMQIFMSICIGSVCVSMALSMSITACTALIAYALICIAFALYTS